MKAAAHPRELTAEHRAKIAASLTGKPGTPWTAEQRARLITARRGRVFSPETRAKISAAHTGKTLSAETRAKISAFVKGRKRKPFTAETLARMSAAQRGTTSPAKKAQAAKLRAANIGRRQSPETIAKRRASSIGKPHRSSCAFTGRPLRDKERRKRWVDANRELMRAYGRKGASTRRARKAAAFIEPIDSSVVFDRDGGLCGICRHPVERNERWDVDHVVPLSKGGAHSYANVQLAHSTCNKRKSAKMPSPEMVLKVAS